MWLLGSILLLAAPVLIGGPRAVCQTTCSDDGDDDACPPFCSQPCCATIATTIPARSADLLPRTPPETFPPPVSQTVPPSTDPAEILQVPKSNLA
jgi:hypothetical protein